GVDIRSTRLQEKHELVKRITDYARSIEKDRPVTITIETLVDDEPTQLDSSIKAKLTHICEKIGLSSLPLDSGAGHDVMNLAKRWPCGLLFIPCRDGVS